MIISLLLGILSSVVAEVVTWVNKKLANTTLKGDGAFLLALVVSFIIALVKQIALHGLVSIDINHLSALGATFSEVFAASQVWFYWIVQKFNLDVPSENVVTQNTVAS